MNRYRLALCLPLFSLVLLCFGGFATFAQDAAPHAIVNPITADNAGDLIPIATIGSADNPISNASIAFSGNSQYLAYVNIGGSSAVGVWDVFAGQDAGLVLGTASGIQWLGFSGTDLTMLAQSSTALYRWSLPSGERYPYHSLSGFPARTETSLSPDGTLAGTRTSDGSFIVGSTVTGESLLELPVDQIYDQSAFSPDNTLLALADPNGTVQLWNLTTGEVRHTLPSNGGYNLAFTADSSIVALCGANDGIEMWNTTTGETLPGLPNASCSQMVFSPDGSLLATSNFLDVSIWDIASAQQVGTYPGYALAISPNGQYLATVTNDQTQLSIWSAPDTGSSAAPAPTEAAVPAEAPSEAPADTSAVSCSLTANSNANLRTGPGTTFDRAGTVSSGETVQADGQSQPGDGFTWYRLTTGAWVRADLVSAVAECAGLAIVSS